MLGQDHAGLLGIFSAADFIVDARHHLGQPGGATAPGLIEGGSARNGRKGAMNTQKMHQKKELEDSSGRRTVLMACTVVMGARVLEKLIGSRRQIIEYQGSRWQWLGQRALALCRSSPARVGNGRPAPPPGHRCCRRRTRRLPVPCRSAQRSAAACRVSACGRCSRHPGRAGNARSGRLRRPCHRHQLTQARMHGPRVAAS